MLLDSTEPFNTWAALAACSVIGMIGAALVDAAPFKAVARWAVKFLVGSLLVLSAVIGAAFVSVEALLGDED